jgi:hypothetical protein
MELRLWWPYDETLLDDFRNRIPNHARKWWREGSEMYWTVIGDAWCDVAQQWYDSHFVRTNGYQQASWDDPFAEEDRQQQRTSAPPPPPPKPPPPPSTPSDWDALYLRRGAPAGLVDAAYRWWCKAAHPDVGGNEEMMKTINSAYTRLKQVAR